MSINSTNSTENELFIPFGMDVLNSESSDDDEKIEKLEEACKTGNIDYVQACLEKNFSTNYLDHLIQALKNGQTEIAELLLNNGVVGTDDLETEGGTVCLYEALFYLYTNRDHLNEAGIDAQKKIICLLLDKGANVNESIFATRNYRASYEATTVTTVLLTAVYIGELDIVKYIIDKGCADINTCDSNGCTPLLLAVEKDDMNMVHELLARKADIHAVDHKKRTILHHAKSCEMIKLLLAEGVKTEAVDQGGNTVLHYIAKCDMMIDPNDVSSNNEIIISADSNRRNQMIEFLVQSGANINAANINGQTPLALASYKPQNHQVVKKLISLGASVNKKNNKGLTPLHIASCGALFERHLLSAYGNDKTLVETTQILLQEGADPKALSYNKHTPLHSAAIIGNIEFGQLLLDFVAIKGQTAEILNKKRKFSHISLFPKVKEMIARENLLNSQNIDGNTSLHLAIQEFKKIDSQSISEFISDRKRVFAKWLIDQPETNVEIENKDGNTPLDLAEKNKYDDIVAQIEKKRKFQSN